MKKPQKPKTDKPPFQMAVDAINARRKSDSVRSGVASVKDKSASDVPSAAASISDSRVKKANNEFIWANATGMSSYSHGNVADMLNKNADWKKYIALKRKTTR